MLKACFYAITHTGDEVPSEKREEEGEKTGNNITSVFVWMNWGKDKNPNASNQLSQIKLLAFCVCDGLSRMTFAAISRPSPEDNGLDLPCVDVWRPLLLRADSGAIVTVLNDFLSSVPM